jgi:uncharacterized protein
MKQVFVDTSHFVAVLHPSDQLHDKAVLAESYLISSPLITSDFILVEVLNYFCEFPTHFKTRISRAVNSIITAEKIGIIKCSHEEFLKGFELYKSRLDKGYSLTDCVSMNIMREQNISQILTHDDHFEQEGFTILL